MTDTSRRAADTLADLAAARDVEVFHRDIVALDFQVTSADLHVLKRIMGHLCTTLREPSPQAWARTRAALAELEGDAVGHAAGAAPPLRAPEGTAQERSPWGLGASPAPGAAAPVPAGSVPAGSAPAAPVRPPGHAAPERVAPAPAVAERASVDAPELGQTAPAAAHSGGQPAMPFRAAGGARAAAEPGERKLTLALYASYCAARDASPEQGAGFLDKHGVSDGSAEEAAWRAHFASSVAEEAQFRELKARFDAWWQGA
jgi:hypothetical protein